MIGRAGETVFVIERVVAGDMNLAPIVALETADEELRADAARFNAMLWRLRDLEDSIQSDRMENEHERIRAAGWFAGPPSLVSTEARELRATELADQLHRERQRIAGRCKTWSRLVGPPDRAAVFSSEGA